MKSVKIYIDFELEGSKLVLFTFTRDVSKEEVIKWIPKIKERVLEQYPKAKFIDVLVSVKARYKKELMMRIGQEVASGWGAVCTGYKTYPESVMFECNEFGEEFTTHLSYDYISKNYGYLVLG